MTVLWEGPTVFRPYPRRLEGVTVCGCHYKGSTFFCSYWKTLSFGPAGVWTSDLPPSRPALSVPTELTRWVSLKEPLRKIVKARQMFLLRVRHIAWKKICVEKTSLKNTDSHKIRRKIRIFFVFWRSKGRGAMRKIRICRSSQETYLLRPFSCVEHVVAS